jgi:hypothetical protein
MENFLGGELRARLARYHLSHAPSPFCIDCLFQAGLNCHSPLYASLVADTQVPATMSSFLLVGMGSHEPGLAVTSMSLILPIFAF